MHTRDVPAVQAIEAAAYPFPWTRGNFVDSLAAGYIAEVLLLDGAVAAYFVAMPGVDELHLLNITVAPAWQGRGFGQSLLGAVRQHARRLQLPRLLLEVRHGNLRAQALYRRLGFAPIGRRVGYYPAHPAPHGREDAVVMSLALPPEAHGLV